VLRYFRRFDEYEAQARSGQWLPLPQHYKEDFAVGVLGMGVLGTRVLEALAPFGFPLRAWSRTEKGMPGVQCFHGPDGLDTFLRGSRVLVCMLPLTPETSNLVNRTNMCKLPQGSYVINVARGAHLAEPDLVALIKSGHIAAATLDVFRNEPLPAQHPFWQEPRITITPHISALTLRRESVQQIAEKIRKVEQGQPVTDVVDRNRGY
jgi:glyoxylate/hydroxypyruvate reductase A